MLNSYTREGNDASGGVFMYSGSIEYRAYAASTGSAKAQTGKADPERFELRGSSIWM